jgi:hypothetical protein
MKVYGRSGRVLKVAGRAVLVTWSLAATVAHRLDAGSNDISAAFCA